MTHKIRIFATTLAFAATVFVGGTAVAQETTEQRLQRIEARLAVLEKALAANPPPEASTSTTATKPSAAPAKTVAPAAKYAKGLLLEVWPQKEQAPTDGTIQIPTGEALGRTLMKGTTFTPSAVGDSDNLKTFSRMSLAFVWSGYVKITKSGLHTFILETNPSNSYGGYFFNALLLNGNFVAPVKKINVSGNDPDSNMGTVNLEPGIYKIQIPVRGESGMVNSQPRERISWRKEINFSLKLKEPGADAPRTLTEDDLIHKE